MIYSTATWRKWWSVAARKHYKKRRDLLWSLKSKPCSDCKKCYHPASMDFDHIKNKKGNISSFRLLKVKTMLKEIAKCELVCSNCHRVRTWKRGLA